MGSKTTYWCDGCQGEVEDARRDLTEFGWGTKWEFTSLCPDYHWRYLCAACLEKVRASLQKFFVELKNPETATGRST